VNPEADQLWRAPRWALAALLALLGMLGPFSIDTYLPAFSGIAQAIDATPVQMQQTLSAYLFGFAFMNLFHGAFADSFGRCRRTSASSCSSAACKGCPPARGSSSRAP
jgi:MFS transporter, DHA1 family, multidrug resistance protein